MNRMTEPPLDPKSLREAVDWAIVTRRSVRAFLPTPVLARDIESILETASHSASGMNTQPWQVHVVTGAAKADLSAHLAALDDDPELAAGLTEAYEYYPRQWVAPYLDRRRKVGWDLYGLLGIAKGDKAGMHRQHGRNYGFFDAPVGLFFTVDRQLQEGSLLDYGMFLQSVMVAARARNLHTCPQAAFLKFHKAIARCLHIPDGQMLVSGMSLGYADDTAIENTLSTEREPVSSFTTFHSEPKEIRA
ncbi:MULTISPECIES: nitroreductase [unclassified Variovorax]|uniref:nitroreductase n=1 Tax=unclassified Variovorax TaxID=663243 RepID=UPI0008AC3ED0|nr:MULTISPECIES: nitroreductase [unclassified Variovorax]SEK17243.1 Nitroreductase [Variovorax sp. OK202]SFE75965.1 Nitroreductase [Variovorax sp. OK212]